jgi:hypothetical protein
MYSNNIPAVGAFYAVIIEKIDNAVGVWMLSGEN